MRFLLFCSNNVFEYVNNFVNMNMNTAETMMIGVGRRRRRQLRSIATEFLNGIRGSQKINHLYTRAFVQRLYKCLL